MVALHPLSPTLNINPQAITDSTIVEECDELYQKFSNVRPSCKKNGCGEHRTSHPHKNPNKKRKRPRVRQPRDAKRRKLNPYDLDLVAVTISVQSWVFVRSSERKSIVTNSKFYLQFNMTLCTLVTMQVEDATQGLGVNEINDEWMSVMIPYWDNIRNNKWVDSLIMMIYWWKRSSPEGRENFEVSPFRIVGS